MENKKYLYENDTIIINGKQLNKEETTVLMEAINGAKDFGCQYDYYMEEECGISKERQAELVMSVHDMLNF